MKPFVRVALSVCSFALAVAVIGVGMPYVTGVSWPEVMALLSALPGWTVLGLVALWLAGLWAYTYVITASLPGLTNPQAFLLNTAGTAVSNLAPFGGAAGVALTYVLARRWSFPPRAVVASMLVSGIWNNLGRLALPAIGLVLLLGAGYSLDPGVTFAAGIASAALLGVVLLLVGVLVTERVAYRIGSVVEVAARALPVKWRPRPGRVAEGLVRVRRSTIEVVQRGWLRLTLGVIAYMTLQAILLGACLAAVGVNVGPVLTIAAFALSRVLTTIVITPGGFGISETGTAALLVALGVEPAAAAAGILLFGIFTFVLEIPLGGLTWAFWTIATRTRHEATQMGERVS